MSFWGLHGRLSRHELPLKATAISASSNVMNILDIMHNELQQIQQLDSITDSQAPHCVTFIKKATLYILPLRRRGTIQWLSLRSSRGNQLGYPSSFVYPHCMYNSGWFVTYPSKSTIILLYICFYTCFRTTTSNDTNPSSSACATTSALRQARVSCRWMTCSTVEVSLRLPLS